MKIRETAKQPVDSKTGECVKIVLKMGKSIDMIILVL